MPKHEGKKARARRIKRNSKRNAEKIAAENDLIRQGLKPPVYMRDEGLLVRKMLNSK